MIPQRARLVAREVPWIALLPLTIVLPILESNPLVAAHSLWAPLSVLLLWWSYRSTPRTRLRSLWLWLLALAVVGILWSGTRAGAPLGELVGPILAVGSVTGTIYFVRAMAVRGRAYLWTATACFGLGMLYHAVQIIPLSPDASGNPWKFGVGYSLSIVVLSLCAAFDKAWLEVTAAVVLAGICLTQATRAMGVVLAIAAFVLLVSRIARGHPAFSRLGSRIVIAAALGAVALVGSDALLDSELFASSAERFAEQAEVNDNSLLAGRTEPPISIAAISENPVVGMGPRPVPTPAIVDRAVVVAQDLGYRQIDQLEKWWTQDNTIYMHSVLADSWVRSGLLAAATYLLALLTFVGLVLRSLLGTAARSALAVFVAAQSVWDIVFSPPAYGQLVLIGLAVGLAGVVRVGAAKAEPGRRAEPAPRVLVGAR